MYTQVAILQSLSHNTVISTPCSNSLVEEARLSLVIFKSLASLTQYHPFGLILKCKICSCLGYAHRGPSWQLFERKHLTADTVNSPAATPVSPGPSSSTSDTETATAVAEELCLPMLHLEVLPAVELKKQEWMQQHGISSIMVSASNSQYGCFTPVVFELQHTSFNRVHDPVV